MSAKSGGATASRSRPSALESLTAISLSDADRLVRDWQKQADVAERVQADPNIDKTMKRILAMQVRVLDVCIADLRDLIAGRLHPDKRRAEQLPLAGREVAGGR